MKKKLAATLSVVLILGLAVLGILAYLTDTDSDVNVMTLGNVDIEQIEKERNAAGEIVDFIGNDLWEKGKPLYPAVGPVKFEDTNQQWETGGSSQLFSEELKNVQDKFVFVENKGKSDAYVRTWFALENGEGANELIHLNLNDTHWTWSNWIEDVEIQGVKYDLVLATYTGTNTVHVGGVLPVGETTRPSLLQVFLDSKATNDDVAKFGEEYDILVFSQAVQTQGFDDPTSALNEAFGEFKAENHPWTETLNRPGFINNANDAYNSSLESGSYKLNSDINTSDSDKHYNGNREYAIRDGVEYTLDLNGHTINHDGVYQNGSNTGYTYLYTAAYNGKLTINGEGTINSENKDGSVCIVYAQSTSEVVINGGNFNTVKGIPVWAGNGSRVTINGGSFISTGSNDEELIYSSGGIIDIYGGFFHNKEQDNRPVNVANANRGTGFINIYGGTFVNFDPSTGGDDPNNIKVMDGYKVVSETQANGEIWYTVVPE